MEKHVETNKLLNYFRGNIVSDMKIKIKYKDFGITLFTWGFLITVDDSFSVRDFIEFVNSIQKHYHNKT